MQKCLVSLVSDQTIPNVLIAAHYSPDYLLFLTTPAMERRGKAEAILKTLALRGRDYRDRCHKIVVEADSIVDLQNKTSAWIHDQPRDLAFIVNLTGGTKLMAIAAYDIFKDFGGEMVYLPIPRNEILTPFPKRRPRPPEPLTERLSVQEYLTAYGFHTTNQDRLAGYQERCRSRKEVTRFLFAHYRDLLPLLEVLGADLRPQKNKKKVLQRGYDLCAPFKAENENQLRFLDMLGFKRLQAEIRKTIHQDDADYLCGGWLEERLFLAVEAALPVGADVCLNVRCEAPGGSANEFDVLFTLDNVLYLIECKSLGSAQDDDKEMINAFLYKLGALRQNFGLTPKAFLATTSPGVLDAAHQVKGHLLERGRQLNTEIIPLLTTADVEAYFRQHFSRG